MSILTTMAALGTGVITLGTTALGVHATTDDPATSEAKPAACGVPWQHLPDQLQSDLEELQGLTPTERHAVALEIRRKAVAGAYGEEVQALALRRREHLTQVWKRLPPELRQDVRNLLEAPPEERADLWADLRDAALAGEYGPRVQDVAERIQARRDACLPTFTSGQDFPKA